jgi:hypothetical protein
MDIKVGLTIVCSLTKTQQNIIKSDINADEFEADIQRRVSYIVTHKLEQCMARLRQEWVEGGKLVANGVTSIPLDDIELAELIFAQPNYKCRKTKDLEGINNPQ